MARLHSSGVSTRSTGTTSTPAPLAARLIRKQLLRLYDRQALDSAQMEFFDWLMDAAIPWAEGAGFQACTEAGGLIGPFDGRVGLAGAV
jgi:hypothetical protein